MSIYHLGRCRQEKGLVIQTNYIQIITEPKHCGSSTTPNKQEPSLVLKTSTSQSPELQRKNSISWPVRLCVLVEKGDMYLFNAENKSRWD